MTTYGILMHIPLLGLLVLAAIQDLQTRRIPNWLSLGLLLAGLARSFTSDATLTPSNAFAGFALGFALTFILFAIGALGGGDVKLLSGVGAWLGPIPVLQVFAVAALIGMGIVLIQAHIQGRTATLLRNSAMVAINLVHIGDVGLDHATETGKSCRSVDRPLPYAVPVLLAVITVMALAWR